MREYESKKKGQVDPLLTTQPAIRDDYNENNNGVDIVDQKDSAWLSDRQSESFMYHRIHQHFCNLAVTQAVEHYRLMKASITEFDEPDSDAEEDEPSPEEKMQRHLGNRHFSENIRWALFSQMAKRCQMGSVGTTPLADCKNNMNHTFGKTSKGICNRAGCAGQTTTGCATCSRQLCFPSCLNLHLHETKNAPVVYKSNLSQKEWET
jgi:hypothetical protein